jgi:hypothetical protein
MNAPMMNEVVWIKQMMESTPISFRLDRFSRIVPGIVVIVIDAK